MNLDLIKKLLSLSASSNENEAAIAFAKAKAMADEAGIDLAIVEAQLGESQKKEEFIHEEKVFGKRFPVVSKFVNWIIGAHFNVSLVNSGGRWNGRKLVFLGRKSDVEFAMFAHSFLCEEFERRWKYYAKCKKSGVNERNAYMWGLYQGFSEKMEEAKQEQVSTKTAMLASEVKNRFELAIVDEKEQRNNFVAKQFPRLTKGRSITVSGLHRSDVISDGKAAGRTISVARPLAV